MPKVSVDILGDASSLIRAYKLAAVATNKFQDEFKGLNDHVSTLHSSILKLSALFVGGGGLALGFKSVIDAATQQQTAMTELKKQMENLGFSWTKYGDTVEENLRKQRELTGFTREDTMAAFGNLLRATGDMSKALKENALAADIARARHMDLQSAALLVVKAGEGMVGLLRRQGIAITPVHDAMDALTASNEKFTAAQVRAAKALDQTATGQKAVAVLQQQFGGVAEKYGNTAAGAQERFRVAVQELEATIGTTLLPTITKGLTKLTDWANKFTESGDAAKYAKETVSTISGIVQDLTPIVKTAADIFKTFADNVGGTKNAVELLGAAFVTWKLATTFGNIATQAKAASTGVGLLHTRMKSLAALGVITVGLNLLINGHGGGPGDKLSSPGDWLHALNPLNWGKDIMAALGQGPGSGGGMAPNVASEQAFTLGNTIQSNLFNSALTGQRLKNYIAAAASKAGLDPQAVLAVASAEGGFSGAVGDHGTSFGPFQLHVGGALPSGLSGAGGASFAQSAQGISYAIQQIAKIAGGLTGMAAVKAIVTQFEKPADKGAGDIARAMAFLGGSPTVSMATRQSGGTRSATIASILSAGTKKGSSALHLGLPTDISGAFDFGGAPTGIFPGAKLAMPSGGIGISATNAAKFVLSTAGVVADNLNTILKAKLKAQQDLWKQHVKTLQGTATLAKGQLTRAFGDLATAALNAFDRATSQGMANLESQRTALTPAEQQLKDLQDAHDQQALETQLFNDQQAGDQAAVNEDMYQMQVRALQKQADAERQARDADFASQEQNYSDQRDLQKQQFQTELANLQAQIIAKHETVAQANSDILKLMSDFGLDPTWFTSGANAGSALIQGLASAFQNVGSDLSTFNGATAAVAAAQAAKPGGGAPAKFNLGLASGAGFLGLAGVPKLATGGYITGSGLAYLHKGETVVPASKRSGDIIVNIATAYGDPGDFARAIRKELTQMTRRGTKLGFAGA